MKQKKLLLGTNLKMYKNIRDTLSFLEDLSCRTKDISRDDFTLFVIPSYTSLSEAAKAVDRSYIKLGAQNMCWEEEGQFTGEISPLMLRELSMDIVEIGHSERRHVFMESDITENKKVLCALKHGFTALLCVGETEEQKEYGVSDEVLKMQVKMGLYQVEKKFLQNLWIAYEPVWAIGVNGKPASAAYAEQKHRVIRQALTELYAEDGNAVPILYGGSVHIDNCLDLIEQPSIDGLFVGRYAWKADQFEKLIRGVLAKIK